jgi:hypothetical protein
LGELIDLARYRGLEAPAAGAAREGACESCMGRAAVAEVFRSDAVAAGLGGRLQCQRCLAAELRRGRCAAESRRAELRLARRLRGAVRAVRVELDWDVRLGRARALDGARLD